VPRCLIDIEAGMGTHYVARELIALGHDVSQVPPVYARPFRQSHKNASGTHTRSRKPYGDHQHAAFR
jgi:transposase